MLDPGSYGAVTIAQAITLDGGGGQAASVMVSSGNGIVVQAGANDVVILKNLQVNGSGAGTNGIRFLSGKELNISIIAMFLALPTTASILRSTRLHKQWRLIPRSITMAR